MTTKLFRHIFLNESYRDLHDFVQSGGGGSSTYPHRSDAQKHASFLESQLKKAWDETNSEYVAQHIDRRGTYIEFKGEAGYDLATKSLDNLQSEKQSGMRVLNVREVQSTVRNPKTGKRETITTKFATVFVSHKQRKAFFAKLQEYGDSPNPETGRQKHEKLVASIADIERADRIRCFWTDDLRLIPKKMKKEWCEVWLANYGNADEVKIRFENYLTDKKIESKGKWLEFPERLVKGILVNRQQLEEFLIEYDDIAELRLMKEVETASAWCNRDDSEQDRAVQDLLDRVQVAQNAENVSICIFDTGVNRGNSLILPVLKEEDCHAIYSLWGKSDHNSHGTLMAGVATYGNLSKCLDSQDTVNLHHFLESVKLLPISGENPKEVWGEFTLQGLSLAEIQAPGRSRINCLAVTASDTRDQGRPTSWSAAIDQATSGAEDNLHRLFIVSAGNASQYIPYPDTQKSDSVHDPGQAWNALTVGAHTELTEFINEIDMGSQPVAASGGLSPFSTTSIEWDTQRWPIKPEIVMEGGNAVLSPSLTASDCDDLSVTSTWWKPAEGMLAPFNMTSAASAQAAWFAAQIQSRYPDIWPETVRALMVHTAEWPDELKRQFYIPKNPKRPTKGELEPLLRAAGYGVPNLERALGNLASSLTLISQAEIQPFKQSVRDEGKKGAFVANKMHQYDLPWPEEQLRDLPDEAKVLMRVTLSYFIEPGPGEIGWEHRYRYPSFGLRFDLKSPSETSEDFIKRINKAARAEDEGRPKTQSAADHWMIGSTLRDHGSIHSDIWQGTATELADSSHIAIYPVGGWWKERKHLGKGDKMTRYSLIVSILTEGTEVDIYTPVAIKTGIKVPVVIEV